MAEDRGQFIFEENLTTTAREMIAAYDDLERKLSEPLRTSTQKSVLGNIFDELRALAKASETTTRQIRREFAELASEAERTGRTINRSQLPQRQTYRANQGQAIAQNQDAVRAVITQGARSPGLRNLDFSQVAEVADRYLAQQRRNITNRADTSLKRGLGANFYGLGDPSGQGSRTSDFGDQTRSSTRELQRLADTLRTVASSAEGVSKAAQPGTRGAAASAPQASAGGAGGKNPNPPKTSLGGFGDDDPVELTTARFREDVRRRLQRYQQEIADGLAVDAGRFIYRPNAADTTADPRFVRRSDAAGPTISQRAGLDLFAERYDRKRDFDERLLDSRLNGGTLQRAGRRLADDSATGQIFELRTGQEIQQGTEAYAAALDEVKRVRQQEANVTRRLNDAEASLDRGTQALAQVRAGAARFTGANTIELDQDRRRDERRYVRLDSKGLGRDLEGNEAEVARASAARADQAERRRRDNAATRLDRQREKAEAASAEEARRAAFEQRLIASRTGQDSLLRAPGTNIVADRGNGDLFNARTYREIPKGTEEYLLASERAVAAFNKQVRATENDTAATNAKAEGERLLARLKTGQARLINASTVEDNIGLPREQRSYYRLDPNDNAVRLSEGRRQAALATSLSYDQGQERRREANAKRIQAEVDRQYAERFQQTLRDNRDNGGPLQRVGNTRYAFDERNDDIYEAKSGRLLDKASEEYARALEGVQAVRRREADAAAQATLSELSLQRANELLARVRDGQARLLSGNIVELGLDKPVEDRDFYRLNGDRTSALPSTEGQRLQDEQKSRDIDQREADRLARQAERTRAQEERIAERRRKVIDAETEADSRRGLTNNFVGGLTSSGFGNNNSSRGFQGTFDGLAQSAGVTAKYAALSTVLYALAAGANQAVQEFLDMEDSLVEVQIAMDSTEPVANGFLKELSDSAVLAGANLGEALDVAASGMRLFKDDTTTANDAAEDIGATFARTAQQMAVLAKTDITDAAGNIKAIATGFDIPVASQSRINDAIVGAKLVGGGDEKQVAQALASVASTAGAAGFSPEDTAVIASALQAATDQSGQQIGTRLSRIFSIVGGTSGQAAISSINASLPANQQVDQTADTATQLRQLIPIYENLDEAQRGFLVNRLGGTANSREFVSFFDQAAGLLKDNAEAYGFAGKGAEEFQRRLENLRAQITAIIGELKNIVGFAGQSGLFAPVFAGVTVLKEALDIVRTLLSAFNAIPAPIRQIGGALLGVVATLRIIRALKGGGLADALGSAERRILPQAALAREELRSRRASAAISDDTVDRLTNAGEYERSRQRFSKPENALLGQRQIIEADRIQQQARVLEQARSDARASEETAARTVVRRQDSLARAEDLRRRVTSSGGDVGRVDRLIAVQAQGVQDAMDDYKRVVADNADALRAPSAALDQARRRQDGIGEQGERLARANALYDRQQATLERNHRREDSALQERIDDARTTAVARRGLEKQRTLEERQFNASLAAITQQRLAAEAAALAGTLDPQQALPSRGRLPANDPFRPDRSALANARLALNQSALGRRVNGFGRNLDSVFISGARDRGAINGRGPVYRDFDGRPVAPVFDPSRGRLRGIGAGVLGLGAGLRDGGRSLISTAGVGIGGALERGARGIGRVLDTNIGKFGLAVGGFAFALNTIEGISANNRAAQNVFSAAVGTAGESLEDAAANLRSTSEEALQSTEGFFNRFVDLINNNQGRRAAESGIELADTRQKRADELEALRADNAVGARPQDALDLSSTDALRESLTGLETSGRDAESQFLALQSALDEAGEAARGIVGPLDEVTRAEISDSVARKAPRRLSNLLDTLEGRSLTEASDNFIQGLLTNDEGGDLDDTLLGKRGNAFTTSGRQLGRLASVPELPSLLENASTEVLTDLFEDPNFDPVNNAKDYNEFRKRLGDAYKVIDKDTGAFGGDADLILELVNAQGEDFKRVFNNFVEAKQLLADIAGTASVEVQAAQARGQSAGARANFNGFLGLTSSQRDIVTDADLGGTAPGRASAGQIEAAVALSGINDAVTRAETSLQQGVTDGTLTQAEMENAKGQLEVLYGQQRDAQSALRDANLQTLQAENDLILSTLPPEATRAATQGKIDALTETINALPVNSANAVPLQAQRNQLRLQQAAEAAQVTSLQQTALVNPENDIASAQDALRIANDEVDRLDGLGLTEDDLAMQNAMAAVRSAEVNVLTTVAAQAQKLAAAYGDPESEVDKAIGAANAAAIALAEAQRGGNQGDIAAAEDVKTVADRNVLRAQNREATDRNIGTLGIGDTLNEAYLNAQNAFEDAQIFPAGSVERLNAERAAEKMMREYQNQAADVAYQASLSSIAIGDTVARGYAEAQNLFDRAAEAAAANDPAAAGLREQGRAAQYQAQQEDIATQGAEFLARLDPRNERANVAQQRANNQADLDLAVANNDRRAAAGFRQREAELAQQDRDLALAQRQGYRAARRDPRDTVGSARDAVASARENVEAALPGTVAYYDAWQQWRQAIQDEADAIRSRAQARRAAAVFPGDVLGAARNDLQTAREAIQGSLAGSEEYYNALAQYKQAQQAVADAELERASLARRVRIDLTDPVANAAEEARAARDRLAQLQRAKADPGQINQAKIDVQTTQASLEAAEFSKNLSAIQDAESLGKITHRAYIQYLEGERDRLQSIGKRSYQQQQQLIEIEKALQAASEQLNGQFNLGDIKLPTVYEVRRSLQQQGGGYISNTVTDNSNSGNTIYVDGADFAAVVDHINKYYGGGNNVRSGSRRV